MHAITNNNSITTTPLIPFGLLVMADDSKQQVCDIPLDTINGLLDKQALLVFRGFQLLRDEEYIRFCKQLGDILEWEFGPILELKISEQPANHIFSSGRVELHWDGAFVAQDPHYNVFQCIHGAGRYAGGNTIFVDTRQVLNHAGHEQLAKWKTVDIEYATEKKAHYGGTIRQPLISKNPYNGKPVIRYIEAYNEDNAIINPMQVRVLDRSPEQSRQFLRSFSQQLYSPELMYRHHWHCGDFVIADNSNLLHGRSRFNDCTDRRYIKRINVI